MNFKMYLTVLWGKKWIILLTVFITMAVVVTYTFLTPPTYTATTTLRVATAASGSVSYSDYMYADRLMNTYIKIATSSPVLTELKKRLGIAEIPQVKVVIVPNTELIRITVDNSNPLSAQLGANTLAEILIEQGKELYSGGGKSPLEILSEQLALADAELKQVRQDYEALLKQSPRNPEEIETANRMIALKEKTYATLLDEYEQARINDAIRENRISVIEPAMLPQSPSQPRSLLNIGLGFLIGLCGGIGLAFLLENINNRLYTTEQIETITGMNILSKVPLVQRMVIPLSENGSYHMDPKFYEALRRLRTNIKAQSQNGASGTSTRTILITSAEPGEGKSTIAAHLAIALAQSDQEVLLIDADMRLPKLHKILSLSNQRGLSTILNRNAKLEDVIQNSKYQKLKVITSGPVIQNPTELLGSAGMNILLEMLAKKYETVIIDVPAFLPVADAAVLAPMVDAVVLVARRVFIRQAALVDVCRQFQDMQIRPIGVVINEAEQSGSYYYYHKTQVQK